MDSRKKAKIKFYCIICGSVSDINYQLSDQVHRLLFDRTIADISTFRFWKSVSSFAICEQCFWIPDQKNLPVSIRKSLLNIFRLKATHRWKQPFACSLAFISSSIKLQSKVRFQGNNFVLGQHTQFSYSKLTNNSYNVTSRFVVTLI